MILTGRRRVKVTPQKGINQVTQTSFGTGTINPNPNPNSTTNLPGPEAEEQERNIFCSTLKEGLRKPVQFGVPENFSEIVGCGNDLEERIRPSIILISDGKSFQANYTCT